MDGASDRDTLIEAIPLWMRELLEAQGRRQLPEPWLHVDLTMTQLKVLFVLDTSGPLRPSAIAGSVGMSAASATGVIDRLAEQGHLERQADITDRRALLVQLTASGAQVVADLRASRRLEFNELLNELRDDDLRALHQGLRALVEVARVRDLDSKLAGREGAAGLPSTTP